MRNLITYTVNKNFNNELYLSVQNGEVVVKAPWYYTNNQIQDIIEEKRQWILNKIKEYEEEKYIRNEIVKLLGDDCKVIINYKNLKKPTLTVEGKDIKICLPNKYKKLNREEILVKLIEKLYDLVAQTEIEMSMERVRKLVGFAPEDYEIKRLDSKMGDCIKEEGVIVINPDIVKYDRETIDYIVLHQFCHLRYKTHSNKFNEIINKNVNIEKYYKVSASIEF